MKEITTVEFAPIWAAMLEVQRKYERRVDGAFPTKTPTAQLQLHAVEEVVRVAMDAAAAQGVSE